MFLRISIEGLEIHHMPNDMVFIRDTVATKHVPALSGNVNMNYALLQNDCALLHVRLITCMYQFYTNRSAQSTRM